MPRNKTITFGKSEYEVEDLRKALSQCKKGSKVKLVFCTNECEEETIEETKLKDLCDNMYFYLSHAFEIEFKLVNWVNFVLCINFIEARVNKIVDYIII